MTFSEALFDIIHREPDKPILEFRRRVFTKGEYAALAAQAARLLDDAGLAKRLSIGVIVRNRALHAAAMLGLIAHDRWLTSIYAIQSDEAIAEEIRESRFAAIIADAQDWTGPVTAAAKDVGALGIVLDHGALGEGSAGPIRVKTGLAVPSHGPFREVEGEPGLEILSSGTTGKPKRVVFPTRMLIRTVESVMAGREGPVEPDINAWPYGGIGGMCALVANAMLDRYTCLLEKFTVDVWVEAVGRLRPTIVSGVPTMARMILDAKVPKEQIASVRRFYGGSAPMTPELQAEFEATYGIEVLWGYGATEFCGTVISWTPALYRDYRRTKLGAMGKALPGISLRVTDPATGKPMPTGAQGILEVMVPTVSEGWIRTTDLVVIDADGFVFHKGRADGAIMRGGFKVLPETVVEVLRRHPAVLDATVVGLPDERLGAVPVAAVELKAHAVAPIPETLRDFVRGELTQPQVPARIEILPALPRTASLKVDLGAVKRMLLDAD